MVGKARKAMAAPQAPAKPNGAEHAPQLPARAAAAKDADVIQIDPRQQQALRVLLGQLSQIKSRIADIEVEKAQLVGAAIDKNRELKTTCENIVTGEGLQKRGAYSLDLTTMTLRPERA